MEVSDGELVARIKRGDLDAFEILVIRYERSVLSIAWSYLFDRHACEDATQDVFLAAYRGLSSLQQPDRFAPWLMQIARRTCGKLSQRSNCQPIESLVEDKPAPKPVHLSPLQRSLLDCIDRLPENERVAITMHYFDGHTAQSIATATQRPLGTVTKQLSRAYARLRDLILQSEATK